ncbi:glycosyltransferase family 4 protein [Clostridium botulinum]|uniref:glycosyltransferase family 4 protein n=1 Tax=Clostridium botulinum TaxID=1491 RepID=UPI001A92FF4F|nr:glycosyltransferase family 4 protein [Clostridium botulinum]MBO0524475.1 glycosyltransferase family 4 protein [Clostridium botulinum]MBO0527328.1 glycosyltransferase family 4 protein [Clostridium botulinum]MBO0530444.1 glycosyltransferase family 4 protein [Clostridium botulinum]MBO0536296.1 glycosyltransferase family 4 protein [Clostridium botulinum]MBO0538527.1 glycosyltransferase family 4 protein [Clostridium botulinum]
MKICYLADANSTHTKKWCKFFKNKEYDIHVISLNDGDIDGVTVHSFNKDLDKIRKGNSFNKISYIKYFNDIKKIIERINPDVVHAHYATSYGLLGALSGFHPYIISVWGSDVYDFPKGSFVKRRMVEYNLSKADIIMSTSKVMAKETSQYTTKNIEITPFGVNIDRFKPFSDKYKKRDNLVVGTVKTLEPKYGIEYLIRAFAKVKQRHSNIKLEIAGVGAQKDFLLNLCEELDIKENVEFLGFINQEKVIEAFNRFDIAVFPSTLDSESFGVAAVEAQACGTPVIVSNVGGLPEATYPNNSSLLVNKKSVDELAVAIEKLIEDDNLRINMGKSGRKFVEDNFNIEDNFNKVDTIYKYIIK